MNEIYVTVSGNVVGDPVLRVGKTSNIPFAVFRIAHNRVKVDRGTGEVIDLGADFIGITAFRALGINVAKSVTKGQPVVVHGRLRVNQWSNGEKSGTDVEIDALSVGFDLRLGEASFTKVKNPQLPSQDRLGDPEVLAAHAELGEPAGEGTRDERALDGEQTPPGQGAHVGEEAYGEQSEDSSEPVGV